MRGKFFSGMTTGAVLGAVAGMMIAPQLDRNTRKKFKRSGRMIKNMAESMYDNMTSMNK